MDKKLNKFSWQQSMLRVKDINKSLEFYQNNFKMELIDFIDFPEFKFAVYFLVTPKPNEQFSSPGSDEAHKQLLEFQGVTLELTYNYGTELNHDFKYHPGNKIFNDNHRDGFGHIAFHCDDVYEECTKLEQNNIQFQKKPDEVNYFIKIKNVIYYKGRMKGLAFALDPDGYWIEIIKRPEGTGIHGFSFGQTMLRISDPVKSLKFYQDLCGLQLINVRKYDDFSLYFLANLPEGVEIPLDIYSQEASTLRGSLFYPVLELTHNHGTEHNSEFVYENGNNEPYRGFGHIGFLVDDVYEACEQFTKSDFQIKKNPNDGNLKGLAFALDPDGYWVEIIKRSGYGKQHLPYFKEQ